MTNSATQRPRAIITGAAGGMGQACARLLGGALDLVLTDVAPTLEAFAEDLRADGYAVAAVIVGDQGDAGVLHALAEEAGRGFACLVHTAGLPPSAPWRRVVEVNYLATVKLLDALEPALTPGAVGVLIASVAGHIAPRAPELDAVLRAPLDPTLIPRLDAAIRRTLPSADEAGLGALSYCLSKRRVIELCEERAAAWGARGARIVSISPGMTFTPMGRHEAEVDEACAALVTSAPLGRWGTPMEIASAAAFLISPAAAFITGSDLKLDGGAVAMARSRQAPGHADVLRSRLSRLKPPPP